MKAQQNNKRKGFANNPKPNQHSSNRLDPQDLEQLKEELEQDSNEYFEDEVLSDDCNDAHTETHNQTKGKKRILKLIVATVSAGAMILGSIAAGAILSSCVIKRGVNSDDKSN
jgi:hypothetical protein